MLRMRVGGMIRGFLGAINERLTDREVGEVTVERSN